MDDDTKFDQWLADYDRKQKLKTVGKEKPGMTRISSEEYIQRFAKVHGGEES